MVRIGSDVHQENTTVAWTDTETGELGEPYAVATAQVVKYLPSQAIACFGGRRPGSTASHRG